MNHKLLKTLTACCLIGAVTHADILYEDAFDNDTLATNSGIGGGAINQTIQGHAWTDDGEASFVANSARYTRRAILYSANSFQSGTGFKLTVSYTVGSIAASGAHNFSFGLIRSDTDPASYTGFNPFKADTSVYSIGANITADGSEATRGLNFTDGSTMVTLDQSGTRAQFKAGETCEVTIEIGEGGYWCYRIDGEYEASGVLLEGFDLSQDYYVVAYGQDDNGGGKSIQSIKLEEGYALGERAQGIRSVWSGDSLDLESMKDFKNLDALGVGFNSGAVMSAEHFVPHKLIDTLSGSDLLGSIAPVWGDLNLDAPEDDTFLEEVLDIRNEGFLVQAYSNSENFAGNNTDELQLFVDRWFAFCDTDPEVQAFIDSQPYHTGVWNSTTAQYEVAYNTDGTETYPYRKYMFCYAEYFLKDYSLRYGKYIDSWVFDSGGSISGMGDNAGSGVFEEQRIYQAFANAIHAGNPEIPIAFNNSRSTIRYFAYPYAQATRFDDFTFGHAFGGNNNHAEKVNGNQFNLNYQYVSRMTETNANPFASGVAADGTALPDNGNTWDDLVVANFHSKISTTAWTTGGNQAWEQDDFNAWTLEAMQAGGKMTWDGSVEVLYGEYSLRGWAYDLFQGLDDHLSQYELPGAPNYSHARTMLPEATIGEAYYHVLVEGKDLWDPEGDEIQAVWFQAGAPAWLNIAEDPTNPGHWVMSGTPTEESATLHEFSIRARDVNVDARSRAIELQVNESSSSIIDAEDGAPVWSSNTLVLTDAYRYSEVEYLLIRGKDFEDFDGDTLTVELESGPSWLSLEEFAPNIWKLSGTPLSADLGLNTFSLSLSDGNETTSAELQVEVLDPQLLEMELTSANGGAYWTSEVSDAGETSYVYENRSNNWDYRSILSSTQSFQSNGGLKLTVNYTTGSISSSGGHNFSFGIVSDETDLSTFAGFNPFKSDTSVYSLGVNLVADGSPAAQGLNFTNGSVSTILDESGTNVQFASNASTQVVLQITGNGAWSYSIDGVEEASGVISGGFDLSKSYKVVVYGQDDNGGGKSIELMSLDLLSYAVSATGYWALDGGNTSTAVDSSGNGFNGTIANATSVAGIDGTALDFNGSNSLVTLPASAFASIDQEITISMWVNGASDQPRADTVFSAENAAGDRLLNIHLPWSNSTVYWDAGYESGYDRINKSATAVQYKDSWSHWVFVKNASTGTMEIYHNGTLFHGGTGLTKSMSGISQVRLGGNVSNMNYSGSIDEVMLLDVALTAEEVADLYQSY